MIKYVSKLFNLDTLYLFGIVCLESLLHFYPIKKRALPKKINKILIIRTDHLGDSLLLTSVFGQIRRWDSEVKIDVLCGSWSNTIYEGNHNINKVHNLDTFYITRGVKFFPRITKSLIDICRMYKVLKSESYDVVIVSRQTIGNLLLFARVINSRCVVGYGTLAFRKIWLKKLCDIVVFWRDNSHIAQHLMEPFISIGVPEDEAQSECYLYVSDKDKEAVSTKMLREGLNKGNFAVICPSAGTKDRTDAIPPEEWARIIANNKSFNKVVITGLKEDEIIYYKIYQELLKDNDKREITLINFMGMLTIKQLYFLMLSSGFIITLDSLPAHLAAMTKVKTISFYLYKKAKSNMNEHLTLWRPLNINKNIALFHTRNELAESLNKDISLIC